MTTRIYWDWGSIAAGWQAGDLPLFGKQLYEFCILLNQKNMFYKSQTFKINNTTIHIIQNNTGLRCSKLSLKDSALDPSLSTNRGMIMEQPG